MGFEGKETARKETEEEEGEVKGQGGKDRQEEPKKAFVVLAYMKGATERLQSL